MPADLQALLLRALPDLDPGDLTLQPIGGGSINDAFHVSTKDNRTWFCKFNHSTRYPALFQAEARGLDLLARQGVIRIPLTIACTTVDERQVLVLEWIGQGSPTTRFWTLFGEQLAALHRVTAPANGHLPTSPGKSAPLLFGLDHPNYMGALPQDNTPEATWTDFFIHRRLEPQIKLASHNGLLPIAARDRFQRLYEHLPAIFPPEPPALLHGDLWSGNFLCDDKDQPVLIDPAVYYGHRSIDLAMTTLFGGFDPAFYDAYHWHYPLPVNHRQQWTIANLYPLLIHLNLFGPGYLPNILHTIQGF
jgi:protein-ribulosamine 3-kinase